MRPRKRKTWEFSFEELIDAPVKRKHIHIEWLTKLSTKEFKEWSEAVRKIYRYNITDETEVENKLWKEIERKEKGYQLTKEKLALEAKVKSHKSRLARFENMYKKDMLYTLKEYNLVATPANKNAYFSGDDKIHRVDKYEQLTATTETWTGNEYIGDLF